VAGQVGQQSVLVQATGQTNPALVGQISVLVAVSTGTVAASPATGSAAGFVKAPDPPQPNAWDCCLWRFRESLAGVRWPRGRYTDQMPHDAVEFHERAAVDTPAPAAGDVTVLDWTVPDTYDGIGYGEVYQFMPISDAINLRAGQRVQIIVNVPNTSGLIQVGTSRIVVGLQGWLYPVSYTELVVQRKRRRGKGWIAGLGKGAARG